MVLCLQERQQMQRQTPQKERTMGFTIGQYLCTQVAMVRADGLPVAPYFAVG
jgi:hypothetical protein